MPDSTQHKFEAELFAPADSGSGDPWLFLILPRAVSDTLPRRGRTSVTGTINGHDFQATLDPDGKLSHWLKLDAALCKRCRVKAGDTANLAISPVDQEPEPAVPDDLQEALHASPEAMSVWTSTTTLARLDWIHWIESAKQAKTRTKRIGDACDMLAEGKKRVCCFDQSGFYSKSLSAPKVSNK